MFCPNCGTQVAEGVRFCSKCGSAVNQAPAAPVYQSAPQYVIPVAPQPARENPMIERVRTAVRKIGGSPLFLVVAICYTLVQLYALLTVGATGGNVISGWIPFLREFGFSSSDINDMISAFNDTGWLVKLISLTFGILTMSGLWAIFAASHSSAKEPGTAGLTIIRVVTILKLVCYGIVMTILLVSSLIGIAALSVYSEPEAMVGVFVVFAAITALIFIYHTKICATISRVKETLYTGKPNHRVSGFVAVICFLLGGLAAIGTIVNVVDVIPYWGRGMALRYLLGQIIALFEAIVPILIGILIFKYRGRMTRLEQEEDAPAAPVFVQPVVTPVAPAAPAAPVAPVAEPVSEVAPVEEAQEETAAEETVN